MNFSSLRDDLRFIVEGIENNNESVHLNSACSLLKLCKSKPREVGKIFNFFVFLNISKHFFFNIEKTKGHILRTQFDTSKLFRLLEKISEPSALVSVCSAACIYFLFKFSFNSVFATQDCIQLLLSLAAKEKVSFYLLAIIEKIDFFFFLICSI